MVQKKFERIWAIKDKLYRLAYSITGNKEDAEDVVQEALLKVWRKKDSFDAIENPEGYSIRTVRNVALDKLELKDNQHSYLLEAAVEDVHADHPDEVAEKKELLQVVKDLITRLPEKQRTVMLLRDEEEMTYKEIALALQITEDQVKISLFRARQKIKENLKKYY